VAAIAESENQKVAISVGPLSGCIAAQQIHHAVRERHLRTGNPGVHVFG
jgi:hypothetical protein